MMTKIEIFISIRLTELFDLARDFLEKDFWLLRNINFSKILADLT